MVFNIAITVCDEHEYLERLLFCLEGIRLNMSFDIDIFIQADSNKVTSQVRDVVERYKSVISNYIETPFEGDFAGFKNNLFDLCGPGYIYQLDADELPNQSQFLFLKDMVEKDPDIDLVYIPRINVVKGITQEDIKKWKWSTRTHKGVEVINFPDYQGRFYKNSSHLSWEGKVHESVKGAYKVSRLPNYYEVSILHIKDIDRQRNQNKMYDNL